jgi:hypothetical protein
MSFRNHLVSPLSPTTGAAFLEGGFAVAELRKSRGAFSLATSAVTQLPDDLVAPDFDSENIKDREALASLIKQAAEFAGLGNKKRWSVCLPEGVARTLVVGIESKPASRRELSEVLAWKIERAIAATAAELHITQQRIRPAAGQERYLVSVARRTVLSEYESLFKELGWDAGLLLPRHLGEVQWLLWERSPGDKLLVSSGKTGFTAIVVQDGEPTLVRTPSCDAEGRLDELFRIARYYRDRMAAISKSTLTRALILGDIDPAEARRVIVDATGEEASLVDPSEFGFDLRGEPVRFDQLAGAAGLATLAWQ